MYHLTTFVVVPRASKRNEHRCPTREAEAEGFACDSSTRSGNGMAAPKLLSAADNEFHRIACLRFHLPHRAIVACANYQLTIHY